MPGTPWNWIRCSRSSITKNECEAGDGKPSPILFWSIQSLALCTSICNDLHVANLAIDDRLIEEARRRRQHKTKEEAVTTALEEYSRHRRQTRMLEAFGPSAFLI